MHTPELGQKLKHLEKLLKETENVAKRYLSLTGKCSTELDDEDRVVIPFDEQLYTKLIKMYSEATAIFTKDEAAIDACLEKVMEMQKMGSLASSGIGVGSNTIHNNLNNMNNNVMNYTNISTSNAMMNNSMNNINTTNTLHNSNGIMNSSNNNNNLGIMPNVPTGVGSKIPPENIAAGFKRKVKDPESPAKKQKRVTKKGVPPSPSSPIVPSYMASVGDLAAARAPSSDPQWILVRITGFNTKTGRYEVEDDAPDDEEPVAKKFVCAPENIVLLPPDSASISINAQPPPNNISTIGPVVYLWYPIPAKIPVLAMFPQTTTFYPAKVVASHKKNKIVQFYQLQFDDDQEGGFTPSRKVNAQYVIPLPRDF